MSSHNFLDADNSIMERNLRFVKVGSVFARLYYF